MVKTCQFCSDAGTLGVDHRGSECRQLPAHAMLPSQGAWVAPAEPPASGEAQRVYGEERQKRGSASMLCTVAGWVCGKPD
jgi:hypothetical protein